MTEHSSRPGASDHAIEHVERFPPGVALTQSPLGGYTVKEGGRLIGWIHQSGDCWNAYRRGSGNGGPGTLLGRFPRAEAVRQIANGR